MMKQTIQQNMFDLLDSVQADKNQSHVVGAGYKAVCNAVGAWPTYVYDIDLNETILAKIQAAVQSNDLPNSIVLNEEQVSKFGPLLQQFEMLPLAEWPMLFADASPKPIQLSDPEVLVKEVLSPIELNRWCALASKSFNKVEPKIWNLSDPRFRFFVASRDCDWIATAMLFKSENSSGIYHCYTDPAFRNLGVGSYLFSHCWTLAMLESAHPIVAQATQQSVDTWKRLGMQPCGNLYLMKFTNE